MAHSTAQERCHEELATVLSPVSITHGVLSIDSKGLSLEFLHRKTSLYASRKVIF